MNRQPRVSVIIAFFNAEKFISEAIESVLAQTYDDWELLLVDDGSSDNSSRIALSYVRLAPTRVRYLQHVGHQNRGLSASRNLGIRNARGEFIAFLDADDVWLPKKLQEQITILASNPKAAMIYGPAEEWFSWTGDPCDIHRDIVPPFRVPLKGLVKPPVVFIAFLKAEGDSPPMSSVLVRREAVERVGGFDENFLGMYEDQVFLVKICLQSYVFVDDVVWCRYRQHPESMVSVMIKRGEHAKARLKFLHWLERYLYDQRIDSEIWKLVLRQLWIWRVLSIHPNIEKMGERVARLRLFLMKRMQSRSQQLSGLKMPATYDARS